MAKQPPQAASRAEAQALKACRHHRSVQTAIVHREVQEWLCFRRFAVRRRSCMQQCSFIHYTLSNPQIRCVAADILWQPSSLPCLGISSTM